MARGAKLVTIYWRDIPAQVNARTSGQKYQVLLKPRFQRAIDRAAMVAGFTTASEYVNEWRQVSVPPDGPMEDAAQVEADRLEACFPLDRLNELVEAGGFDPSSPQEEIE